MFACGVCLGAIDVVIVSEEKSPILSAARIRTRFFSLCMRCLRKRLYIVHSTHSRYMRRALAHFLVVYHSVGGWSSNNASKMVLHMDVCVCVSSLIHPREWRLMYVRQARDMRHNIPIANAVKPNEKHEIIIRRKSWAHVVNATLRHAPNACCDTHVWISTESQQMCDTFNAENKF